jgi:hypothetical protein
MVLQALFCKALVAALASSALAMCLQIALAFHLQM